MDNYPIKINAIFISYNYIRPGMLDQPNVLYFIRYVLACWTSPAYYISMLYVLARWTSPAYYVCMLYVFPILGTYQLTCTTSDTQKALTLVMLQHTMVHLNHGHTGAVTNLITMMTPVLPYGSHMVFGKI